MNERDYIEQVKNMSNTSEPSAKRYAAQLRAGSKLTVQLQADGILSPGTGPLDLSKEDYCVLKKLNRWQALQNLDSRQRAAIKLFLEILDEVPLKKEEALRIEQAEARALSESADEADDKQDFPAVRGVQTLKKPRLIEAPGMDKRVEPPVSLYGLLSTLNKRGYTQLMRALLQDHSYTWNNDQTENDLHRWGRRYDDIAALIRRNLLDEEQRQYVIEDMSYALKQLTEREDQESLPLSHTIAASCKKLEQKAAKWYKEYPELAGAYSRSKARILLRQLASMDTGIGKQLYSGMSDEGVTSKLVELFEAALDVAEDGYPEAVDLKEQAGVLNPETADLLAVVSCGFPVQTSVIKGMEQEELLLKLTEQGLLVPMKKSLLSAECLDDIPLSGLADGNGQMKEGAAAELFWKLLRKSEVFETVDAAGEDALLRFEELINCLQDGPERQEILEYIVKYYWIPIDGYNPEKEIVLLEHLLKWWKKYPDTLGRVLCGLISKYGFNEELLILLDFEDELFEGVLQSRLAQTCLELAQSSGDSTGYWSSCAANVARKALALLEAAEEPGYRLRTQLILALSLALQGNQEAERDDGKWPYTAQTLAEEYLLPCLILLKEAEAELKECWLTGKARTALEEILADKAQECRKLLTGEDSALARCLREQDHDFSAENWCSPDWVASEGLHRLTERDLFQVMHRQSEPAKLFLPWYCNTFDSTLACGPECTQELTEAGFLNILLSGQKVVLAANQMADNEKLWNMAEIPAFLWCLKNGYVSASLFGSLKSLGDYVSGRMKADSNFIWSSLPEEFQKPELREGAGRFLTGQIPASYLPAEHRQKLTRMRDAIRLMDENMPAAWTNYYHQQNDAYIRQRRIPAMIPLEQRIADYYSKDREISHYDEMRRLNEILIRSRRGLNRSDYRKMLWAIRDEDFAGLEDWNLSSAELEQAGLDVSYLASERKDMLQEMIYVIDDCQNRMLGERISTNQYYVYSEAAAHIVPEWQSGPVNSGGRALYRQAEKNIRSQGGLLGWEQIPERMTEIQRLADENPNMDAEKLCRRLAVRGLYEYDVFGMNSGMRLKNLSFRASTGKAVSREYTEGEGNLHQVERDLTVDK